MSESLRHAEEGPCPLFTRRSGARPLEDYLRAIFDRPVASNSVNHISDHGLREEIAFFRSALFNLLKIAEETQSFRDVAFLGRGDSQLSESKDQIVPIRCFTQEALRASRIQPVLFDGDE